MMKKEVKPELRKSNKANSLNLYPKTKFCNHLDGEERPIAMLSLSSRCLVVVMWLFLMVPWVCLQFVIVVFPDHTHLLFLF